MTATQSQPAPARSSEATATAGGLPAASLPEALSILLTGVVPALVRGLFAPRRWAMKLLTALDAEDRTVSVLSGVRRKHDGQGVRLLGGRLVVLWGEGAIKDVLDRSADVYASDSGAKGKGMSHFHPDALTLSRGEEWRDRRAFSESVLATPERVHPFAARFLVVIADEVERLGLGDTLDWERWERLFDRIALRVIFGDQAREDQELTSLLEKLMGEANRLVGLSRGQAYYDLYARLERYVRDPGSESLVSRIDGAPHTDTTRIAQQIPHWMFATRDTLGANAYRALAAIVADPEVEQRVRGELEGADPTDPAAVDGLRYLEGCLQEAMRLWPTTPLLARETTRETTLAGERLEEGTQVMVLNVFNHRDPDHVEDADRLRPERWRDDARDYRFNHLSNGSQDCPGGSLVLLLGKAVLAQMLDRYSLDLRRPDLGSAGALPRSFDFYNACFWVGPRSRT
jgi:cytochrome P450